MVQVIHSCKKQQSAKHLFPFHTRSLILIINDYTFRNSDSIQVVNLNTASFAGQVKMGLSTIGIHLVATE